MGTVARRGLPKDEIACGFDDRRRASPDGGRGSGKGGRVLGIRRARRGLHFGASRQDLRSQLVPSQTQLAASDALNGYTMHTGSGVFACPGGVASGGSRVQG
jgi:hypothetical protein